jgi:hypothetical protein
MEIVVETYRNPGEPSTRPIRVRPVAGQGLFERHRVWCSVSMRRSKPVGSLFLVNVSLVHQPQGASYLRVNLNDRWKPLTREEANRLILSKSQ